MVKHKPQYRQGDVLIERVGETPEGVKPAADAPILAEGEVSGHRHGLYGAAMMFRDDGIARSFSTEAYIGTVDMPKAGELRHVNRDGSFTGEHDTIAVPDGRYTVIGQREYTPEGEMRAQD